MIDLLTAAQRFASAMTDLFSACVHDAPTFEVTEIGSVVVVGPSSTTANAGFGRIPLRRARDEQDLLSLKVEFRVGKDDSGDFMRVESSTFGLWVATGQRSKARPVFRVEYDRDATSKPQAHVHIHAESVELGWIYGSAGLALPNMHEIHFPVGGKRFRPTVEDLLLFLQRENLFTEWRLGWRAVLDQHLAKWEETQAKATARRFPAATAEALKMLGYVVSPPPIQSSALT